MLRYTMPPKHRMTGSRRRGLAASQPRHSGQSQSAVARTFGVSRQTVWRAERTE